MVSVSAKNLVVTRLGYPAIADGSFELPPHHFALVTGANGSGKTTLLKAIAGSVIAERGSVDVTFNNNTVTSENARKLRRLVSYVGHTALYMRHIKVSEHLVLCQQLDQGESAAYVLSPQDALSHFHLEDKANVRIEDLSAGQQRRVHLASSFVRSTPLICVDEPHASLDETSKNLIDDMLSEQYLAGRTLIVATHDPDRLNAVATHHVRVKNGTASLTAGESS